MQQRYGRQQDILHVGSWRRHRSEWLGDELLVQGDLGWRKMVEGREEMVIFGKRLVVLEEGRLVKVV